MENSSPKHGIPDLRRSLALNAQTSQSKLLLWGGAEMDPTNIVRHGEGDGGSCVEARKAVRRGLYAGGRWIRTFGSPTVNERGLSAEQAGFEPLVPYRAVRSRKGCDLSWILTAARGWKECQAAWAGSIL
jgi:hypothetical protein